jgi:hypothetical protein
MDSVQCGAYRDLMINAASMEDRRAYLKGKLFGLQYLEFTFTFGNHAVPFDYEIHWSTWIQVLYGENWRRRYVRYIKRLRRGTKK